MARKGISGLGRSARIGADGARTFPLIAGLKHAQLFFDVAFFIVLVSLIVQGWTVAPVARLLGLQMPKTSTRIHRTDIDLPGTQGFEIVSYRVSNSSALVGKKPKALRSTMSSAQSSA